MTATLIDPTLVDGRYRLDGQLGAGAFGTVYKAAQIVLDKPMRDVALKLFHGDAIRADNVAAMMNDAIQIQAVIAGLTDWGVRQHFVTVYDLGVTRDALPRGFVCMELVPGGSLEGRIRTVGKFTLQGTLHYLRQIARALAHMHDYSFVHSDLKPANVLVFGNRGRDHVKIGDFGLAGKYVGGLAAQGPRGGTMSYMAPEALDGLATTPSCDVFSMGVMAYEMLTGSNPYDEVGRTLPSDAPDHDRTMSEMQRMSREVSQKVSREDYPELRSMGSDGDVLGTLIDVINIMLHTTLSRRYVSANPVSRDLELIAQGRFPRLSLRSGTEDESPIDAKPRPDAAAAPPTSVADPLQPMIDKFHFSLNQRDWADAMKASSEISRAAPGRATGYLLKAEVSRTQAQLEKDLAQSRQFRLQAIQTLERGVNQCSASSERRELRSVIAILYEELEDYAAAQQIRNLPS